METSGGHVTEVYEWFPKDSMVTRGYIAVVLCGTRFTCEDIKKKTCDTLADELFPKDGMVTGGHGTVSLCGTRFTQGGMAFDEGGTS